MGKPSSRRRRNSPPPDGRNRASRARDRRHRLQAFRPHAGRNRASRKLARRAILIASRFYNVGLDVCGALNVTLKTSRNDLYKTGAPSSFVRPTNVLRPDRCRRRGRPNGPARRRRASSVQGWLETKVPTESEAAAAWLRPCRAFEPTRQYRRARRN
jgi:hypothetical protein